MSDEATSNKQDKPKRVRRTLQIVDDAADCNIATSTDEWKQFSDPDVHWIEFETVDIKIDNTSELEARILALESSLSEERTERSEQIRKFHQKMEQTQTEHDSAVQQLQQRLQEATTTEFAVKYRSTAEELEAAQKELATEKQLRKSAEKECEKLGNSLRDWDAKEKELARLRNILKFSQLKKDSDKLHEMQESYFDMEGQLASRKFIEKHQQVEKVELERLRKIEQAFIELSQKWAQQQQSIVHSISQNTLTTPRQQQQQQGISNIDEINPNSNNSVNYHFDHNSLDTTSSAKIPAVGTSWSISTPTTTTKHPRVDRKNRTRRGSNDDMLNNSSVATTVTPSSTANKSVDHDSNNNSNITALLKKYDKSYGGSSSVIHGTPPNNRDNVSPMKKKGKATYMQYSDLVQQKPNHLNLKDSTLTDDSSSTDNASLSTPSSHKHPKSNFHSHHPLLNSGHQNHHGLPPSFNSKHKSQAAPVIPHLKTSSTFPSTIGNAPSSARQSIPQIQKPGANRRVKSAAAVRKGPESYGYAFIAGQVIKIRDK